MRSLFPPWSNTAIHVAIFALVAGVVAVVLGLMLLVRSPWRRGQMDPVRQPVQFDHRHHVQDDAIDCLYCHKTADRAATAGIPATDTCMGCHAQIWSQSVSLEPVRRSWFAGEAIPWRRVYQLPDFVYFNHLAHVSKGVGCVVCHGRVDQMPQVYLVPPLTMTWCLDCHRAPEAQLRPPSEVTNMRWDPGEEQRAAIGAQVAEDLGVRRLTHCSTCHR